MKIKQIIKRAFLKRKNGYTLVEVIVASALLAVLLVGMTMFIGPVMANVSSNEKSSRASNVAESVQYYISRNLRNASFVAIFSEASIDDFTSQSNINDPAMPYNQVLASAVSGSMPDFVSKQKNQNGEEVYELKCMSIRAKTDSKSGDTKYYLYDESFSSGADTIDSTKETAVFEQCFFEGIYMKCSFAHVETPLPDPDTSEGAPAPTPVTPTYRPALEIGINVYDNVSMDSSSMLFSGRGYTELINIKNAEDNKNLNLPYKVFHNPGEDFPKSLGTGTDTFIFYVVRKVI